LNIAARGEAGEEAEYIVDNSQLCSRGDGIAYRFSKKLDATDRRSLALYGERVKGVDEGDGWLKVDLKVSYGSKLRYLPMVLNGKPVLVPNDDLALSPRAVAEQCSDGEELPPTPPSEHDPAKSMVNSTTA